MNNEPTLIPYIAYESVMVKNERANKRLWILSIILIALLLITNTCWIIYENQFIDEMYVEQEVDAEGGDAYVNGIGDFNYGESEAKDY